MVSLSDMVLWIGSVVLLAVCDCESAMSSSCHHIRIEISRAARPTTDDDLCWWADDDRFEK